jgi:hypothetical protein
VATTREHFAGCGLSSCRVVILEPAKAIRSSRLIGQELKRTGSTPGDIAAAGSVTGGLFALLLFPEPITIFIGFIVGLLFGFGGRNLQEIKDDATGRIMLKFNTGMSKLDRAMEEWCTTNSSKLYQDAASSFGSNIEKVFGRLNDQTTKALLLPKTQQR